MADCSGKRGLKIQPQEGDHITAKSPESNPECVIGVQSQLQIINSQVIFSHRLIGI